MFCPCHLPGPWLCADCRLFLCCCCASRSVLLYEMLCGVPPFRAKNRQALQQQITGAKPKFPKFLSSDVLNLLKVQRGSSNVGSGRKQEAGFAVVARYTLSAMIVQYERGRGQFHFAESVLERSALTHAASHHGHSKGCNS